MPSSTPLQIIPADDNAYDRVRALCLPLLPSAASGRAAILLPDDLIAGPGVGVMAERMVIRRVGPDWRLIVAGTAPPLYADGDPAIAQLLLLEGVLLWCCYFLTPQLQQLVPTRKTVGARTTQYDLDWSTMRQGFAQQANATLELLVPVAAASALSMASPIPAITDPDADRSVLVPRVGSVRRVGW